MLDDNLLGWSLSDVESAWAVSQSAGIGASSMESAATYGIAEG